MDSDSPAFCKLLCANGLAPSLGFPADLQGLKQTEQLGNIAIEQSILSAACGTSAASMQHVHCRGTAMNEPGHCMSTAVAAHTWLHFQDKHGNSALHLAALGGQAAAVQLLLSGVKDALLLTTTSNKSGQLPVHCAGVLGMPCCLILTAAR